MMNTERDKFLTEAIGECWHEINGTVNNVGVCEKCGEKVPYCSNVESYYRYSPQKVKDMYSRFNNDFSTWGGFGNLLTNHSKLNLTTIDMSELIIRCSPYEDTFPDRFATQVYKFLKEREK